MTHRHIKDKKNTFKCKTRSRGIQIKNAETFTGVIQASDRGFAFIIPDDKDKYGKDFFVPKHSVCGAYEGDRVLAARVKGTDDEACVVRILERGAKRIVGTLQKERKNAFVFPDNLRQPLIFIHPSFLNGAKDGDKVVCEITSYPKNRAPGGKVTEILGESGHLETEELSIIRAFALPEEFPEEVIKEAQTASEEKIILNGRRDLRDKLIITIDGEDTRDIDDGVSMERDGENYVLGVHIADVSSYVKPNSVTDNEAYSRGTSVYFPDRVLPMLPESLSNGACSLNEGEDRYALSCIMTFDKRGQRTDYQIFKSVIKSRRRTTYGEIEELCNKNGAACNKHGDLAEAVGNMKALCLLLEKRRERLGSVNLDVKEAHIYVKDGEIVIPESKRLLSQRIIEQFMISANEAVAEFLQQKSAPCLFRVHESPSPEKAENFFAFLRDLGVNARGDCENLKPADMQKILNDAADKPFFTVINKVMLRTMQKARYSEKNLKHFGLASDCYCHFTSPIRRYPDLFVHRALHLILDGADKNTEKLTKLARVGARTAIDCSERERIADEAERKVDDLYKLAYMSERLGEVYDALISGVTKHGIYCELENTVEGLIPFEDLPDDEYELIPEKFILKGQRKSFRLGDTIKIKVTDCDLGRMKVLFAPVEKNKKV